MSIETSIPLRETAFHGPCGWSRPTVGAVTCSGTLFGGWARGANSASLLHEPEFRVLGGRRIASDSWSGVFRRPKSSLPRCAPVR